ncbi:MAG: LysR family transcriptional regulator [Carnobacterium sp.]|uniref:LysR family transcriptional regulator n=1 Tax=Carnobacterium antarcticum TaxID=2126436 RepID=A0ABW4NMP6_9LACT|nr:MULTISPECIES: LysR family transcriptional regulator [unclassified Carnobacterium]ALV21913.1 Malolactic regulator [Carnobacterium sp. CP1]QQP69889.1 LysR family transcriptional regulator [Carnobacterium sp. CS13]
MNLQDLVYFNRLAETLNFTATAEHFYVSQPSISMTLKRLEKELDTVLIDRKRIHKNLRLTETGEILLKYSTHILKSVEQAKEEIHDLKNQVVYFGFLPTIGGHFMAQLMPHLKKFSASMKLIEEESSDVMLDLVRKGQVPLAIIGSDRLTFAEDNLLQIPLKKEEMALWASPDNPLAKKDSVTAAEIQDELFISLAQGYTHQRIFKQWMKDNHIEQPQTLYTKEIQTALSIASSTHMLAFMSDILVEDRPRLVRIPIENAPQFYISLIVNKKLSNTTYFQTEFNEVLIELAESYGKELHKK